MTRVEIDLNVRVRGNGSYAGFEDVTGPLLVGEEVEVYESESGLAGRGRITEIDTERELVYLSVDWASMQVAPEPVADVSAGLVFTPPGSGRASYFLRLFGQKLSQSEIYDGINLVLPAMSYSAASTARLLLASGMVAVGPSGSRSMDRQIWTDVVRRTFSPYLEFTQFGPVQDNVLAGSS